MKTESAVSDWSKYPNQFRCFLIGTNKKNPNFRNVRKVGFCPKWEFFRQAGKNNNAA